VKATIAMLHPGDMGSAVGACLAAKGERVIFASEGRSAATRARAESAGLQDCRTLKACVEAADIVLSVCPPHGALELAREVAAAGFRGVYVDANAISPENSRTVGAIVSGASAGAAGSDRQGADYVDAGIVGPPPRGTARARLFLAGPRAGRIAVLFEGTPMQPVVLEGEVGSASALKACYAAWTKGSTALLAAIRVLARVEGVEAQLLEEWKRSQGDLPKRSENIVGHAHKAWRWIGEMEEIAASFGAAGLPQGFHLASADIYRLLEGFKDRTEPPVIDEVLAMIGGRSGR